MSAFHIYFPDPWPKKRHRKRRIFNNSFGSANWFARSITSQEKSTLRRITRHIFGRFKSYLIATRILSIVPKNLLKLITFRRVLKLSTENKDIQSTELYTPNHRPITSFAVFKPRQPTIYDITQLLKEQRIQRTCKTGFQVWY